MNSRQEADAARKRLLLARGALQRVTLRSSIEGLQQGLRPKAMLSSAVGSSGAVSMLLGLATRLAGNSPAGRVLRYVGAVVAIGGMVRAALARNRRG